MTTKVARRLACRKRAGQVAGQSWVFATASVVAGLLMLGTPAEAEYSLKPAPESVNRMYQPGTASGVQNADPWGYAAMAIGPDGRSWVIAAGSESAARSAAQSECDAFGTRCDVVVSGPDHGFFIGGYCQDGPRAAYSAVSFADAQDKFYGYVVHSDGGIVMNDQNCTVHWLGHRVTPPWAFRQARR
ncbi:hypothetical protein [Amorphus sp. 3PC139-8]|uniref:hypothetical protein n=1 Tax=Amorphus sp. 3PC139-8 TaxID=2735676 RepID=UPI00345DC0E9